MNRTKQARGYAAVSMALHPGQGRADAAGIVLAPDATPLPPPVARRADAPRRPNLHNRVDAHIGARIRARRKVVGLSQEGLADALGLTVQQVHNHERGRSRLEPARLSDVARVLGVEGAYFYEDLAMAGLDEGAYGPGPVERAAEPRPEVVDLVHTILFGILARPETMDLIRSYGRIADPRLRRKVFEVIDDREPAGG